ncbi:glycosyltransferase family 4 protein [Pontibacter populi]|uniref:Glycosyltransferase family 1 protein n=1 Tax=Pontibacter populi TaxID=890055 RepID=A0ABV1RW82_9BACT
MHITYFFRKLRPGAFSIENLFLNFQMELPVGIKYTNHFLSRQSDGFLNRIKLVWETFRKRGEVNHITGDVNFIVLLLPKGKTILTIHDIESLNRNNRLTNFLLQLFWLRMPVARVKYVTVVSQTTKDKLLKALTVNPDKVVVIPNAISPEFTYQPKSFNKVNPTILQVGTKYNKNLERTIEALAGIACTFMIVGQLTHEQEKLLIKYKINYKNHVGITNEELRTLYAQADIVTFVSLFEGFGVPILEAQATGRPVITSNCSSMPEVAGSGALLVDPINVSEIRDGILKLLQDDELRTNLIAAGLENCKRYSNKAIAQQYIDLYKKL